MAAPVSVALETVSIATFERNSREEVRIELVRMGKERWLFSVRAWFTAQGGDKRPSRDGLAITVDKLPAFSSAVAAALAKAREDGLVE